MKIAIVGYGKMGRIVEKMAREKGHEIVTIIDSEADWKKNGDKMGGAEVAIEFSTPDTVVDNIHKCFTYDVPVVTGTTAWDEHYDDVCRVCLKKNQALFTAANFSLGVNLFFRLNRYLAMMMNDFAQYELRVEETHHVNKLDRPSGTAKQLVDTLLKEIDRKTSWGDAEEKRTDIIRVISHRVEDVPGTHEILYESPQDSIRIQHMAKNRNGFAAGAITAAEWLKGKKGCFTMDDLLATVIKEFR